MLGPTPALPSHRPRQYRLQRYQPRTPPTHARPAKSSTDLQPTVCCQAMYGTDLRYVATRGPGSRVGARGRRSQRRRSAPLFRCCAAIYGCGDTNCGGIAAIYGGDVTVYGGHAAIFGGTLAVDGGGLAVYGGYVAVYGCSAAIYGGSTAVSGEIADV
eukprot:1821488-Rhodomonas_salina.2